MGQKQITVFYETGFNGIDIPAGPSVLENMPASKKKTYPDFYWLREDVDLPIVRIKDTYDHLCNIDYVKIVNDDNGNICYYFAVPSSNAQGTTTLSLTLDALTTLGGAANLTYTSGWQERGHISKNEDALFSNTASEDWIPSQPLEAHGFQEVVNTNTNTTDVNAVITSIDLTPWKDFATTNSFPAVKGIVDGETDPVMNIPKITAVAGSTSYLCYDWDTQDARYFSIPNSAAFEATDTDVLAALDGLYSVGAMELQTSYKIPKEWVIQALKPTTLTGADPYIYIDGWHQESETAIRYDYSITDYEVKNNKCYSTYRNIILANAASGDMVSKTPSEIYEDGTHYPSVRLWADPCSTGKPYGRFKYIKGEPFQYSDCVKGLQWANNQIVMTGASGSLWNSIDNAFTNATMQRQYMQRTYDNTLATTQATGALESATMQAQMARSQAVGGLASGWIGGVVSPIMSSFAPNASNNSINFGGAASTGAALANNALSLKQSEQALEIATRNAQAQATHMENSMSLYKSQRDADINQNRIGLLRSNSVQAPQVQFTPEQNLSLYGYNRFYIYEIRKTDEDLKSEDEYYQRYGYNGIHRPLTQACFNVRDYYVYVQAFDVNISSRLGGMRTRMAAISQLNRGVRVWKVLPNADYYEIN